MKKIKFVFSSVKPKTGIHVVLKKGSECIFVENNKVRELHFGIGDSKNINQRKFITLIRKIIRTAKQHELEDLVFTFDDFIFPKIKKIETSELASIIGQNTEMANFEFTKFKTKPKEGWKQIKTITILGDNPGLVKKGITRGQIIGEYVNHCRVLANTPGSDMTPTLLAKEAQKAVKSTKVRLTTIDEKTMKALGMGAILSVSQGSNEPAKLIVMEYWGAGKPTKKGSTKDPLVLVGKGITFDSGGLSIKSAGSMLDMHHDMAGGASVISAVALAAKLGVKKNVIGIIPAVENMVSGSSYRPGDIVTSMSGKTIEIRNTDAEGRVVLSDGITYARKFNPRLVIDVATLTGASLVALGERASAIMTKDKKLENLCLELAEDSGDYMWPLPLWEEYEEEIKGTFGDIVNSQPNRWGGAIEGGTFLHEFARDLTWAHIDIAPRMTTIPSNQLAKGAAGEPVRFLLKLIEEH